MAVYRYTASTLQGEMKRGVMHASAPEQLRAALRSRELYLIRYREQNVSRHQRKLGCRVLSEFCMEMSTLLSSGVTVTKALTILSSRNIAPRLRTAAQALLTEIKHGVPMSEAMEQQGAAFPPFMIALLKAGEESGTLDRVFARLAEHYEKEYRLLSNVRGALAYPLLLLGLLVCVMVGLFTFVLPKFFPLFEDGDLPLITRLVMDISTALREQGFFILIVCAAVIGLCIYISRLKPIRLRIDACKLKLPFVGNLLRIIYTAQFARTLATLYSSGVSILNALRIARDTISNAAIRESFDRVIHRVRAGNPLSAALDESGLLDSKLPQTIQVGEETGQLDEMLRATADAFDYESQKTLKKLVTFIEPVMIILMAALVLVVIGAVMLPIYEMYDTIETRY